MIGGAIEILMQGSGNNPKIVISKPGKVPVESIELNPAEFASLAGLCTSLMAGMELAGRWRRNDGPKEEK